MADEFDKLGYAEIEASIDRKLNMILQELRELREKVDSFAQPGEVSKAIPTRRVVRTYEAQRDLAARGWKQVAATMDAVVMEGFPEED